MLEAGNTYMLRGEARAAANRRHYQKNRERIREQHRAYKLRTRYGLTPAQADALSDRCQVCGRTDQLHIDHDHASGAVRGRLCTSCNQGLGRFRDDPELLRAAADYLANAGSGQHLHIAF